jgi:hypothetical protein
MPVRILFFFLFSLPLLGQQSITHYSPKKGNLMAPRVADIFPIRPELAWLRQDMPWYPATIKGDTTQWFEQSVTGLNPYSNPTVGAFAGQSNTTWLVFNRTPSWVEGTFGPSNGGLVRLQNNTWTLFNSQNFPPFSKLREKLWYCAAMPPGGQYIWIGGDSGIRKIDLATFQVRSFFNDSTLTRSRAYWRRGISSPTGVWFRRDNYAWVYEQGDSLAPFENARFGLADSLLLVDVAFLQADTFFLTHDRFPGRRARLWKRNGTSTLLNTTRNGQPQQLQFLTVERNTHLHLLGESGLFRLVQDSLVKSPEYNPAGKTHSCLVSDPAGNRYIGTLDSGFFKVRNLNAQIQFPKGKSQAYCYQKPVEFSVNMQDRDASGHTFLWFFGDGSTSTEAAPRHLYKWTGQFRIRLRITNNFGSQIWLSDTLELRYTPPLFLLPGSDTVSTCSSVRLRTTGRNAVTWHLPDGSTRLDTGFLAQQPGLYWFQTSEPSCQRPDSVVLIRRPETTGEIRLTTLADSSIGNTDTLLTFLPVTLKAREVPGFCSPIWTVNETFSGGSISQALTFESEGKYQIEVRSTSVDNCASSSRRNLFIKRKTVPEPVPFLIPNLVMGKGNASNQKFTIQPGGKNVSVQIFNRWGQKIFTQSNYTDQWPEANQPGGTYFYQIKIEGNVYSGWVEWVP